MTKREPGEWVPSGNRGRQLDGGKVSQQDRWWPMRWWRGHWLKRRSCGRWREDGGPYRCGLGHGHGGGHEWTPAPESLLYRRATAGRRLSAREREAAEYRAYVEARYAAAEHATRGNLVNEQGRRRGVSSATLLRSGAPRYASEELRDWLRDHGPTLSASDYHAQHREQGPYPEVP